MAIGRKHASCPTTPAGPSQSTSPASRTSTLRKRLAAASGQVALGLAAALAVLCFAAFLIHSFGVVLFPYPVAYNEGAILYESTQLAHGQNIYSSLATAPYLGANYTPLYYLLCTIGAHLLGPVLLPGRAVSLMAGLGSGVFVFLLLRMDCRGKTVPLLSTGLFFALPAVYTWSSIVKSDMLALLFSLAGLYVCRRFRGTSWFMLAPLAFTLAFYTKQTALAAPFAIGLCLLVRAIHGGSTDRRHLMLFSGWMVFMIGLPFVAMQAVSHGEFARHVILYNAKPFSYEQLTRELTSFTVGHFVLMAMALGALWYLRGGGDTLLLRLYLLFGLGFAVFAIGREGASTNYYLDALAGGVLLTGLTLDRVRQDRHMARIAVSWLVLAQLVVLLHWPGFIEPFKTPEPDDWQAGRTIMDLVTRQPGEIFAENSAWPALAGRQVVIDDVSTILPLAEMGIWDQTPLLDRFRSKGFSLLLTEIDPRLGSRNPQYLLDRYTPEILSAIQKNYRVFGRVGSTLLLKPLE